MKIVLVKTKIQESSSESSEDERVHPSPWKRNNHKWLQKTDMKQKQNKILKDKQEREDRRQVRNLMITDKNSQANLLQFHKSNWEREQLMKRQLTSELCLLQKTVEAAMEKTEKTFPLHYIRVVTRHKAEPGHDLSLASDEVVAEVAEVSLPASSAELTQLGPLVPLECPVSQSRGPSGERHRFVTSIHGYTIADVREESGALLIAPFPESQQQEVSPRAGEDSHEKEDQFLEEKLEGGTGNEAPDEDRENEGGKGRDNVSKSAQTLPVPGEARSENGQSALSRQGQGEGAASQPAREAPGPGEGSKDDGSHQGRPDQREGREEVVEPDQDPVLQPLQPLEG